MRGPAILSILLLTTAPAFAASHTSGDDADMSGNETQSSGTMASDATDGGGDSMMSGGTGMMVAANAIEDASVFSLGAAYDADLWESNEPFGPITADWAEIGEVQDLILNQSGQVQGVTVDVGGFLGLGERAVMVPVDDVRLVQNPDDDTFYVVTRMTRSAIEEAEEVEDVIGSD